MLNLSSHASDTRDDVIVVHDGISDSLYLANILHFWYFRCCTGLSVCSVYVLLFIVGFSGCWIYSNLVEVKSSLVRQILYCVLNLSSHASDTRDDVIVVHDGISDSLYLANILHFWYFRCCTGLSVCSVYVLLFIVGFSGCWIYSNLVEICASPSEFVWFMVTPS